MKKIKPAIQATISLLMGAVLLVIAHEVFWEVKEASTGYNKIDYGFFGWHSHTAIGFPEAVRARDPNNLEELKLLEQIDYQMMALEWILYSGVSYIGLVVLSRMKRRLHTLMRDSAEQVMDANLPFADQPPSNASQ